MNKIDIVDCAICHLPVDWHVNTTVLLGDSYLQCHYDCAEFFESSRPPEEDRLKRIKERELK